MGNVRGSALIPRIAYLKANHADAWPAILAALKPKTRETLELNPLATGWYPFEQFVDLIETADRVAGAGDLSLVRKLGHHAATANLSTFLRIFIRFGSPEFVFGKAARLWSMHHDTGRAETEETPQGKGSIAFQVFDFGTPHKALCVTLEGWVYACLEAGGAKSIVVREVKCRLHRDDRCRYEGTWR